MPEFPFWAMTDGPLMTSMSLAEYAAWLREKSITRIRINFTIAEVTFYCADRSYFTTVLCGLLGINTTRQFAPEAIDQALNRAWRQRISFEQFLIRLCRAGCAYFSLYLLPDLLAVEGHEGQLLTRPICPGSII